MGGRGRVRGGEVVVAVVLICEVRDIRVHDIGIVDGRHVRSD